MPSAPLPRRLVLTAFAVGFALQATQTWIVGDQRWMLHHAGQFAAGATVWWVATWGWARLIARWIAIGLALFLPVAYVLSANGLASSLVPELGWRSALWWGNPHLFGVMLACTAAIASILITRVRWTGMVLWLLAGTVTIAIWSRGTTFAVLLGATTWLWTRFAWKERLRILVVAVSVLAGTTVVFHVGGDDLPPIFVRGTVERFFGGSVIDPDGRGGAFVRLYAHDAAWQIVTHTFPWGVGHGRFPDAYREIVAPDAYLGLRHAHHEILQRLVEGGLFGLLAWVLPITTALWRTTKRAWWMAAPFVAIVTFLWGSEGPFLNSSMFYGFWIVAALGWQVSMNQWQVRARCEETAAPPKKHPAVWATRAR